MHSYAANHVDFIHNTAYHNAQSPELNWRQISGGGRCRDILVANNILHAQEGRTLDTNLSFQSSGITYRNNIIFGDGDNDRRAGGAPGKGSKAATLENNINADPLFVNPSLDPETADFQLRACSPAIDAADPGISSLVDKTGTVRLQGKAPDLGALEALTGK